jgi:hypothetical protein
VHNVGRRPSKIDALRAQSRLTIRGEVGHFHRF